MRENRSSIEPFKAQGLLVRGSLPLDALTFEKIVTSHEYVLVKFDTAYPFGDLHDEGKILQNFRQEILNLLLLKLI